MIDRPAFKQHYLIEIQKEEGLLAFWERGQSFFAGKNLALVAFHIDGARTTSEIIRNLDGQLTADEIRTSLAALETEGLITEANHSLPVSEAAFWWMQNIDPLVALKNLSEKAAWIETIGTLSATPLIAALDAMHVRVAKEGQCKVVLTDDYLSPALNKFNHESLESDQSWMLMKPVGSEIWIGPIFIPGRTGCWQCLADRLRMNRAGEAFLQATKGKSATTFRAFNSASIGVASNLAAIKIARWIAQGELPELEGQILSYDLFSGASLAHTLIWRPQCSSCGDIDPVPRKEAHPVVLHSAKKNFTIDGGHRTIFPEATFEKYSYQISPITGCIQSLERYSISKSGPVHVYGGSLNCVATNGNFKSLIPVMSGSGKGATDAQARTSALCESLERYSGIFQGDEPRITASYNDLENLAIHPDLFAHFSKQQYRMREVWNARKTTQLIVPEPFSENIEIEWSPVWSLTQNQTKYLPTAYCYYHYKSAFPIFFLGDSNGNAGGNTLEEAILQGFFELVERDSIAIWWYNKIPMPEVDWRSFGIPYLNEVDLYHQQNHREIRVLDITSDLRIPVFAAISRRTDGNEEKMIAGFGAHFDSKIAMLRAMTELNQGMVWTGQTGFGVERQHSYYDSLDGKANLNTVTSRDVPQMRPDSRAMVRNAQTYPEVWNDDLKEDVLLCRKIIESQGMEMLVLDQTRADVGFPVVKVIVPGLRHFWPRFAPGRLYDVPVKLGWLSQPLTEDQLNPIILIP